MRNAKNPKPIVWPVVMSIELEKTTVGENVAKQQAESLKTQFQHAWARVHSSEPVTKEEQCLKDKVSTAFRKLRNGIPLTEGEMGLPDTVLGKRELPEPSPEGLEKFQRWARKHKVKLRQYLPPVTQQELSELRESQLPIVVLTQKTTCGNFYEDWVEILPGDVRADILIDRLLSTETAERFEIHMLSAEVDFWRREYDEQYEEVYGAKFEQLMEFIQTFLPVYSEVKKAREIDKANKERTPEERKTMIKALYSELPDWLITELVTAKKSDRYEKHPQDLALKHTAKLLGKTYSLAHMKRLLRGSKQASEQVTRALEASEESSMLINVYNDFIS